MYKIVNLLWKVYGHTIEDVHEGYVWNVYFRPKLLGWYWKLRSEYTPTTCGYECDWVHPYGFVPEAGCPVHDRQ